MDSSLNQLQAIYPNVPSCILERFLNARQNDLEKAIKMYQAHLNWRQQNEIDSLNFFEYTELPLVTECYPHGFLTEKDKFGETSFQLLLSLTNEIRLVKHFCKQFECLSNEQLLVVVDMKGGTQKVLSKNVTNFVIQLIRLYQDNYPEMLFKMFIINAPMMFSTVWQIIKPSIDEKTRSKIVVTGQEFKDQLGQYIDDVESLFGEKSAILAPYYVTSQFQLQPQENRMEEEEDSEEEREQLQQLKLSLQGFNTSQPNTHAPSGKDKYQLTTQNHKQMSDTPLNTEIGDDEQQDEISFE